MPSALGRCVGWSTTYLARMTDDHQQSACTCVLVFVVDIHQSSGAPFAVKIMRKASLREEDVLAVREEVTILRSLEHPNIIRCVSRGLVCLLALRLALWLHACRGRGQGRGLLCCHLAVVS